MSDSADENFIDIQVSLVKLDGTGRDGEWLSQHNGIAVPRHALDPGSRRSRTGRVPATG
jgi:hypothetical protein